VPVSSSVLDRVSSVAFPSAATKEFEPSAVSNRCSTGTPRWPAPITSRRGLVPRHLQTRHRLAGSGHWRVQRDFVRRADDCCEAGAARCRHWPVAAAGFTISRQLPSKTRPYGRGKILRRRQGRRSPNGWLNLHTGMTPSSALSGTGVNLKLPAIIRLALTGQLLSLALIGVIGDAGWKN